VKNWPTVIIVMGYVRKCTKHVRPLLYLIQIYSPVIIGYMLKNLSVIKILPK